MTSKKWMFLVLTISLLVLADSRRAQAQSTQYQDIDVYAAYTGSITDAAYFVAFPGGWGACPANDPYGLSGGSSCVSPRDGKIYYGLWQGNQYTRLSGQSTSGPVVVCAVPASALTSRPVNALPNVFDYSLNILTANPQPNLCENGDLQLHSAAQGLMSPAPTTSAACNVYIPKLTAAGVTPSQWTATVVRKPTICADTSGLP